MKDLILTGTYQEYQSYSDKSSTIYIHNISDLRGLQGLNIRLVGTYNKRPDWESIHDYLIFANFTITYG